jgi:phospholipase C
MSGIDLTRRDLLRAGATGAALGASALASQSLVGRAVGATERASCPSALRDIEHIVVLMQENRSFDQYFGTFPGVRGFADPRNRRAFSQPGYDGPGNHDGRLLPFHLQGRKPIGQCVADPTHNWEPQHQSWNGGKNSNFVSVHSRPQWDGAAGPTVMGYFRDVDIPYYWALAKAYTLCDMYFCSVLGPTEPNRLYAVSATLDPAGRKGGPSLSTVFDGDGLVGDFRWTTMPEQLQARGISWKSYTAAGGQFDSPFPAFRQFRDNPTLNRLGIQPAYPADFVADLDDDALPAVSWIQVPFNESEHAAFAPALGEYATDQVLRAIWARPKVWRKTAVIINYDENGGFFDHVAPPVAPPGTKGEFLTVDPLPATAGGIRGPIGLGFRVPCIVVSPWSRGGFVASETFDHTSVLRLIERRFGPEVPNLSAWRRSVTGDLTSAFNFAARPDYSVPKLPPTSNDSPLVTTEQCKESDPPPYPVPSTITMPRQKSGRARRPSGVCRRRAAFTGAVPRTT